MLSDKFRWSLVSIIEIWKIVPRSINSFIMQRKENNGSGFNPTIPHIIYIKTPEYPVFLSRSLIKVTGISRHTNIL